MITSLRKARRGKRLIDFVFVNTIQYLYTFKNNIYHSNKRGPPRFIHSDTNPVLSYVLVHSVDKTYVLVITVELIWLFSLNILSFNFVLRLPAVVITNHCQSYTVFFALCALFKVAMFHFLQLFLQMRVHLCNLSLLFKCC